MDVVWNVGNRFRYQYSGMETNLDAAHESYVLQLMRKLMCMTIVNTRSF